MSEASDPRLYAAPVARNRDPILDVLSRVLPPSGLVLELASGSGEHAVYFAKRFPGLEWQPTDADPHALASVAAHRAESALANLREPRPLDAASMTWPVDAADAIVCINMIHISPWTSCEGLMAGARRILKDGGILYLYGPYKVEGSHTAESNREFDLSLQQRNAEWGVRDLSDIIALARRHDLILRETIPMPANNLSVIFERRELRPA